MTHSSLDEIATGLLVCDVVLETMRYADGIFVSRTFEELNLWKNELVTAAPPAYLDGGGKVFEKQIFGSSSDSASSWLVAAVAPRRSASATSRRMLGSPSETGLACGARSNAL